MATAPPAAEGLKPHVSDHGILHDLSSRWEAGDAFNFS
jgi:hypothetical protein